jgi:hypothetical protein
MRGVVGIYAAFLARARKPNDAVREKLSPATSWRSYSASAAFVWHPHFAASLILAISILRSYLKAFSDQFAMARVSQSIVNRSVRRYEMRVMAVRPRSPVV